MVPTQSNYGAPPQTFLDDCVNVGKIAVVAEIRESIFTDTVDALSCTRENVRIEQHSEEKCPKPREGL